MPGITRNSGQDVAGGALIEGSGDVFANDKPVVRIGDAVAGHGPGPHAAPVMAEGNGRNVYANEILVCHANNVASCGHPASGSGNVWVNEGYVPPIILSPEVAAAVDAAVAEAIANPPTVGETGGQVPTVYEGAPAAGVDDLGTNAPLVDRSAADSTAAADQIPGFLSQVLAEANNQQWDETGDRSSTSNGNIINIWRELGFPDTAYWQTDQTPWCAGFCNWVLKRTGYKYMQSARAYDFRDKTSVYGGVPVPLDAGQPGDIVVWNYSHVNFIYTSPSPGVYTFVGGNQSDSASATNNNPSGGTITNSWKGGWTQDRGRISGIFRPVRA
jgi:uncharacterized protein (TIGR02594 family)